MNVKELIRQLKIHASDTQVLADRVEVVYRLDGRIYRLHEIPFGQGPRAEPVLRICEASGAIRDS